MVTIFLFLISCLALALPAWFTASWVFRHQPLSGALLYLYLFLMQITVTELILGILKILNPIALCLGSILVGLTVFLISKKTCKNQPRSNHQQNQ
ncbi:MAG: hypothetical protein HC780_05275, partial [Leptolyngbyaceae cyanobacterium CSU_1_3]|nr:hypothetical protein [Leptolyngbyaceae cyanobacterium CSU_1_3]